MERENSDRVSLQGHSQGSWAGLGRVRCTYIRKSEEDVLLKVHRKNIAARKVKESGHLDTRVWLTG